MEMWYPDDDAPIDPNWWAPLMRLGLAAARDGLPALDPEEFMFMGRVVRKGRPDIWLFKHIYSRRYANVDECGEPYRYIPPKDVLHSKSDGRYVTQDRRSAWWNLDLIDYSPAVQATLPEPDLEESFDDEDDDWSCDEPGAA